MTKVWPFHGCADASTVRQFLPELNTGSLAQAGDGLLVPGPLRNNLTMLFAISSADTVDFA